MRVLCILQIHYGISGLGLIGFYVVFFFRMNKGMQGMHTCAAGVRQGICEGDNRWGLYGLKNEARGFGQNTAI